MNISPDPPPPTICSPIFSPPRAYACVCDYQGYPEYPQLFPFFEHAVSILDLIFNTGPDATRYMKLL